MPRDKGFDIFESAQPANKAGQLVSKPAQEFDMFDQGLTAQPVQSSQTGQTTKLVQEAVSESGTLFGDAKAQTFLGEIGAGLQIGTRQLISTAPALAAIAASPFSDGTAQALVEYSNQIAEGGAKRGIARVEDLTIDPRTWARYAAGVTGEAVPFIASLMAGGGAGRLLANLLIKKGVPLSTRKLLASTAPETIGTYLTASSIETASTLQELHQATGDVRPLPAMTAGAVKGAFESIFPMVLSKQLGLTVGQAEGLMGRLLEKAAQSSSSRAARIAAGIGTEGLTELAQEEVDIITRNFIDENAEYLSPEMWSRRLNALVAGGVGGGIFSAMTPTQVNEAVSDQDVRNAALDAPILYGAGYNEVATSGPEDMVKNSHGGLDATAGLATGQLADQLLGEVDLRKRGLYAAAVPGRPTTFGSQEQANNDAGYYGVDGFVRLDPNKVKRGDITASVEDIPDTVADPRVEFLDQANAKQSTQKFIEAIKLKQQAVKATKELEREQLLNQAEAVYKEAVDLGLRVEPYTDSQVILRDESKVQQLVEDQQSVQPQLSSALSESTVTLANGTKLLSFRVGDPNKRKNPGGKALDLENVDPNDITGLPSPELARSVLASQAISQRLSISAARGQGITFKQGVSTEKQVQLLQDLIKVLTAMTSQKASFLKNKSPIVERFMKLVGEGLRIDVKPESPEFVLMREAKETELIDTFKEVVGPDFTTAPGQKKLVKSRARRQRDPQVSQRISFENKDIEELFFSQFHSSFLQKTVVGDVAGGSGTSRYAQKGTPPVVKALREIVKSMRLKTDFLLEIVAPGNAGESGVKYENREVQLTEKGKPQKRTVISIDPWKFGQPTEGGKPLTRKRTFTNYVERGGNSYNISELKGANLNKTVNFHGKTMKIRDVPRDSYTTHILTRRDNKGKWFVEQLGTEQDMIAAIPNAIPVHDLTAPETVAYVNDKSGKYEYKPIKAGDKVKGKTFYHGTKSKLKNLSDSDVFGFSNAESLYGMGLYVTENPAVAESYAQKKGKGPEGKVLAAKIKDELNLIDLEETLPDDVQKEFHNVLNEHLTPEEFQDVLGRKGRDVFDRLREVLADNDLTSSEALETLTDLQISIANLGYDGFVHEGGQRRADSLGPHNVLVLFENSGIKDGQRVGRGIKEKLEDVEYTKQEPVADPAPPREQRSKRAKQALKYGVPENKFFTSDAQVTQFWSELSYNLGKIVMDFEWDALSAGEQDAIRQAHQREAHLLKNMSRTSALSRVVVHPLLEKALGGRGRKESFYQFEEWVAQNIARTLAGPKDDIGLVTKFFQSAGAAIKKVLNAMHGLARTTGSIYAYDPKKGNAHEEVQKWVSNLYERGRSREDEGTFLSESTKAKLLSSIRANQKALAGMNLDYAVATPQRASSVQIRQLLKILPKDAVEDRKKLEGLIAWSDRINTTLEWGLGVQQLSELNPHIPQLSEYVSNVRAMENESVSWASMADTRLRDIQKLGKNQAMGLWAMMADLDALSYQDAKKLAEGKEKPRWPTGDELLALVKKHKLNKQAFETYLKVRQDYLSFLSYLELVSIRNAEELVVDPQLQKERINEIKGEIAQIRARPYFPHMRFGKYAITVRNNKGEVVHFETFDKEDQRLAVEKELVKTFNIPKDHTATTDEISPVLQHYQGLPKFALDNIKRALGLNEETLTEGQKKDKDILEAMAYESAPITSFRHNLRERKRTPGFSMDGARSYANYFARSAKFVSRMAYAHRLEAAIKDVRKSGSPVSKDSRTRIADYLQKHFESEMNPSGDLATLRSMAFSWYFAFLPSAAFVNLTQMPMVSWPYLSGKFGDFAATPKLAKAFTDNITEFWGRFRGKEVPDTPKQEAIDQAHDDRLIDDGFATELAAIANGSVLSRTLAVGAVARKVRHLAQWGAAPFALAERTNRSVTFRAAYDLAIENPDHGFVKEVMFKNKAEADRLRIDRGWNDRQIAAYLTGAQAVRDTQFEYARWARPKLMTGNKSILFMFKTYLQNMLFFMFKQDRGIQARFLLTLMASAGVMGMPGAEDMEEVAKWLGRKMGYNLNPTNEMRSILKEFTDQPDIFLHGASRVGFGVPSLLQGLGIPSPTPDLSGSLSMGKLVPGLASGLNPDSSNFREVIGDVTTELLGPAVGVPLSMYQALTDFSVPADDPKRWERALPRALRSASRSSRYFAEQRERDRGGATVYQFDPNDWNDQLDIVNTGLGFQPTKISRQWDFLMAQREAEMYWQGRRKILLDEFWRTVRLKDQEGKADAITSIKEFNSGVPIPSLRITRDQVSRSLQTRQRNLQLKENQIPRSKYLRPLASEVQKIHPEAQQPHDRRLIQEREVK